MKKIPTLCNSLAVVLPRFGRDLGGGAETLVGAYVEQLAMGHHLRVEKLEVWTTCARDHRTWANELPAGVSLENGVTVRRFPVDSRDTDVFIRAEFAMRDGFRLSIDEQLDWLANSVNSSDLYAHIVQHGAEFDAILFAPYLFATSFWGPLIYPERSLLVPCLHNEHYAYSEVFAHLFRKVRGLIFNAAAEMDLADELYSIPGLAEKSAVVGMGFEQPNLDVQLSSLPQGLAEGRYLLYSGRKEQGKNLDLLIDYFCKWKQTKAASDLKLVIVGAGEINFLEELPQAVLDFGFVSEEQKIALMKNALALCQPSTNESFSIVLMEAWLQQTPVIVHADCAVTREHAISSGGGLYFANGAEFSAVLDELIASENLCEELGKAGHSYVCSEYSWPEVMQRLYKAFQQVGLAPQAGAEDTCSHDQGKVGGHKISLS